MGAGAIDRYHAGMRVALRDGFDRLCRGESSLDAVVSSIVAMENDSAFNAGPIGAVLNSEGAVETEASLMDGRARRSGSVGALRDIQNPIHVARLVMERTDHVSIVGSAARDFASSSGWTLWHQNFKVRSPLQARRMIRRAWARSAPWPSMSTVTWLQQPQQVGLAESSQGGLATARQIGAGTWADDRSVAVSVTGRGEAFVRSAFAARLGAMHVPGSRSLHDNCVALLRDVASVSGFGGCITLDRTGLVAAPYSTRLLHRGIISGSGSMIIASGDRADF